MTTIETILRGNQCSCRAKGIYINNEDNSLVKDNLDNLGDNEDNDDQQYKQ